MSHLKLNESHVALVTINSDTLYNVIAKKLYSFRKQLINLIAQTLPISCRKSVELLEILIINNLRIHILDVERIRG